MSIDDIYTTPEKAIEELKRRWDDDALKTKIENYFKGNIPKPFLKGPKRISASHVATPNWFMFNFYTKTKEMGLKPIVFEYLDDIFVTTNYDKASLGKMVFYHGRDVHGDMLTSSKHVIDLSGKNEKKRIRDIETVWGENLVDFHHRATNEFYEGIEVYDGSTWYHEMGKKSSEYYKYVFALYIRNGILFENFLLNNNFEKKFVEEVIMPAFEHVRKEFGMKPLIVPLIPRKEEDSKYWWCYPTFVKILVNRKLGKK